MRSGHRSTLFGSGRVPAGAEHADLYRKIPIILAAAVLVASACSSAASQPSAQPSVSSSSPAPAPSVSTGAPVTLDHSPRPTATARVLTEPQAEIGSAA